MDYIVYIFYPLLLLLLLYGSKLYGKNAWNDDFMSLTQTKAIQGFFAICIMFHHLGQKTCAPWLKEEYIVHGLDFFVPIGYLFVAVFLFCSGYGLYKSYLTKENYLTGFFARRILPLILAFVTTSFFFLYFRMRMGDKITWFAHPFSVGGPDLFNTYAWFIFALMVLYIGFYVAFRFCKKEKFAIAVLGIIILLYMLYCDWWIYGDWWYNTVILFLVGLLFAKYEEKILAEIKKRYMLYVILAILLTVISFMFSESIINRWGSLMLQMIAATSFVAFVLMLGMKLKVGNRVLTFIGGFTLELYLVHGLFVQLFGYRFIKEEIEPLYYIRNVAVYTLVVFVISVPLAFGLHFCHKVILTFLENKKEGVRDMCRYLKKIAFIFLGIFLVITLFFAVTSHKKSVNMKSKVTKYGEENITYAEVDGRKMAAYVTGEGKHTIVLLSSYRDVCPTVTLKPLADTLAENYKVIILDQFGCGYSDTTDKERSAENLIYEVHTALRALGEKGPYILMPYHSAGFYAQLYTEAYPEEVEAVVALDTYVAGQVEETIRIRQMTVQEYERYLKRTNEVSYYAEKLFASTGFSRMWFNAYRSIFRYSRKAELEVIEEMWVDNLANRNAVEEAANEYQNAKPLFGKTYGDDMPVLFLLANYSCKGNVYGDLDWMKLHENVISNPDIQKIEVLAGTPYFAYYTTPAIAEKTKEFIDGLH